MFRTFIILIFGSFIAGAILTPFVMSGVHTFFPEITWPFSRVFGRAAQVATVVLIFVLRKDFNLAELKKHFSRRDAFTKIRRILFGVLLTTVSIMIVIPLLVQTGILAFHSQLPLNLAKELSLIFLAMFFVSLLEESFFRVLVFSSLKSKINVFLAATLSSLLYAFVHFIAPVKSFKYPEFDITAGFSYLFEVLQRYAQPDIYPAFFGLFLVGIILCYVIYRTESFALCVGLHMGWAAGLKLIKMFTVLASGTEIPNDLGGRYFLVAQPQAWLSMLVVFAVLALLIETKIFKREINQ